MSATGFTSTWLQDRYAVDARSRNKDLTSAFIDRIPRKKSISLVDLGAGIGNNVIYFLEKINQNINWYLIEVDPVLIDFGKNYLPGILEREGYKVDRDSHCIRAQKNNVLHIHFVQVSLFEIKPAQWLAFDGMVGNALLDVFSQDQIIALLQPMIKTQVPKLFSIVYQGMFWRDNDPLNEFYIAKYHEHMHRNQNGICALGPDTWIVLEKWFKKNKVVFRSERSDWDLIRSDNALLSHLLNYYEHSILKIISDKHELKKFNQWLSGKKSLLGKKELSAVVRHRDILL